MKYMKIYVGDAFLKFPSICMRVDGCLLAIDLVSTGS
jgi:hypothetical protein